MMQQIFEIDFWPIASIGATLLCALLLFCRGRAQARKRAEHQSIAGEALEDHFRELKIVLDDERTPERIRKHLLAFSESIVSRQEFKAVLQAVISRRERSDPHALDRDLNLLAATDDELKRAFLHCIHAGLASAILRFPEAGYLVEETFVKVLGNPQQEAAVFAKATQRKHEIGPPQALAIPA